MILLRLRKNSSSVEIKEMFLRKSSMKSICYQIAMVWFFMKILCVPFRHPQPPCPTPKGAIMVLAKVKCTSIPGFSLATSTLHHESLHNRFLPPLATQPVRSPFPLLTHLSCLCYLGIIAERLTAKRGKMYSANIF